MMRDMEFFPGMDLGVLPWNGPRP